MTMTERARAHASMVNRAREKKKKKNGACELPVNDETWVREEAYKLAGARIPEICAFDNIVIQQRAETARPSLRYRERQKSERERGRGRKRVEKVKTRDNDMWRPPMRGSFFQ